VHPSFGQLEAFYWVVRLGSIKQAAQHLHLAQPTVSLRISDLEGQFGHPVFERAHRKLTLTRQGEALVPRVTALINELSALRQMARSTADAVGVARIGLSETVAQVCLPACVKRLARDFPSIQLDITIGTSGELEQDVMDRKLDLAFVINPRGDPDLSVSQLGIQGAIWAAAPSLGLRETITAADLAGVTVITNPYPSPMYRQILDWFRDSGLEPSNICRCTSLTVAVELVRDGLGVSLLPSMLVQQALQTGALIELKSERQPPPSRLYYIFRSADRNRLADIVARAFKATMIEKNFLQVEAPGFRSGELSADRNA
jgi:DNA-binding transcriptional LysR family regulator